MARVRTSVYDGVQVVIRVTPTGVMHWLGSIDNVPVDLGGLDGQRLFCCTITTRSERERSSPGPRWWGMEPITTPSRSHRRQGSLRRCLGKRPGRGSSRHAYSGSHDESETSGTGTFRERAPRPAIVGGERGPTTPVEQGSDPGATPYAHGTTPPERDQEPVTINTITITVIEASRRSMVPNPGG